MRPQRLPRGGGLAGSGMAGVLFVIVIAVAIGVRMSGSNAGSGGSPASPQNSRSPSPLAAASPASSVPSVSPIGGDVAYSLGDLSWQEVGIGTFDGVEYLSLFPIDQGLLVLGTSRTAQARLWLSSDGFAFQPLDASAFARGDPAKQLVGMTGLVKGPAGYIAVGRQMPPAVEGTKSEAPSPLVWRSADGLHWSRLDPKGLPQSGIRSIAATSNGYVVALDAAFSDSSMGPLSAYTSTDDASWQATSIATVDVVGHDGHIVAVTSGGAVAVTDDGSNWTTLHPAKQVVTMEAGPDGFVGITYDQATTHMSVIRSPDGRTWTTAGDTTGNWTNGMVYAMGGWVMLGPSPGGPSPWSPIIMSTDGVAWQSTAIPYEVVTKSLTGGASLTPLHDRL